MRLLLLKEDYVGACLIMTDCTNEQLQMLIEKLYENDENGIGETIPNVADELFPLNYMAVLGDTESSDFKDITELNTVCIANCKYLSIGLISQ